MKFRVACALVALAHSALALHFRVSGSPSPGSVSLFRRGNIDGSISQLNNSGNVAYRTNLTIGGTSFSTLIDTGRYVLNALNNKKFLNIIPF
jgi:hypothetical protein